MTIWEALFGSPEAAAKTIDEICFGSQEVCWMLDAFSDDQDAKCRNCLYEYDGYGCEPRDLRLLEWLNQEVDA